MRIDCVHNSLRNWEIIIELCKGLVLYDIDEFLECFDDYESDDGEDDYNKYKKAIEEKEMDILEQDFPNMMYEKIEIQSMGEVKDEVRYIVCFND